MGDNTMRNNLIAGAAVGLVASVGLALPASAESTGDPAQLAVLHGIPETPVDVYINEELTLDDFESGSLGGPLELPADTYSVVITAADAEDTSSPLFDPVDVMLEAGGNYTVVAHLTEEGEETATLFENDISATEPGEGRATVRHTAAVSAVDVMVDGETVITGLTNPNEEVLDRPAGVVEVAAAPEGETDPTIGPAEVEIMEGVNTIAYAIGGGDAELSLAVQTVNTESAPEGVDSGEAGLAAEGGADGGTDSLPLLAGGAAALAVIAVLVFAGVRAARARR